MFILTARPCSIKDLKQVYNAHQGPYPQRVLVCSSGITPYNNTPAKLPISDHKAVLFNTDVLINQRCIAPSHLTIRPVTPEDLKD